LNIALLKINNFLKKGGSLRETAPFLVVIEFTLVNSTLPYVSRVLSLNNPEMIPTRIKIPPTRKRINALVFRSPHKKKFGASDDTKYKYPPNASNTKAESKINVLKNPISTNQLKACKNFCRSNNKIVNFN